MYYLHLASDTLHGVGHVGENQAELFPCHNVFCLFSFHCLEASGSRRKEHPVVIEWWLLHSHVSFSDQPNQNQLTLKIVYLSTEFWHSLFSVCSSFLVKCDVWGLLLLRAAYTGLYKLPVTIISGYGKANMVTPCRISLHSSEGS